MVTLTYRVPERPEGGGFSRRDLVNFRKRLRINWLRALQRDRRYRDLPVEEIKALAALRFFIVAERGGLHGAAHYHAIIFGADAAMRALGVRFGRFVRAAWRKGNVHIGRRWSAAAAAYCAKYVTKGHTSKSNPALEGADPEFAVYPGGKRGGLGAPGLPAMLPPLLDGRDVRAVVFEHGDVPSMLPIGEGFRFAGRYLLRKLRQVAGLTVSEIELIKLVHARRRAFADRRLAIDAAYDAGSAEHVAALADLSQCVDRLYSPRTRFTGSPLLAMLRWATTLKGLPCLSSTLASSPAPTSPSAWSTASPSGF